MTRHVRPRSRRVRQRRGAVDAGGFLAPQRNACGAAMPSSPHSAFQSLAAARDARRFGFGGGARRVRRGGADAGGGSPRPACASTRRSAAPAPREPPHPAARRSCSSDSVGRCDCRVLHHSCDQPSGSTSHCLQRSLYWPANLGSRCRQRVNAHWSAHRWPEQRRNQRGTTSVPRRDPTAESHRLE